MIDDPISKYMNCDVLQGGPDLPLAEVISRMNSRAHSAFIVCDDGRPIGVISERDALAALDRNLSGELMNDACARDVMTSPARTLAENAAMSEVVRIMNERRFRRVPITDREGRLSGIVNLTELQGALNTALERRGRDLEVAVMSRTAELQAANEQLKALSVSDGMTGLLNRRAMSEKLDEVHDLARRYGNPYSILLIDIDHFKIYNDTLGHLEGDDAIRAVASLLQSTVRTSDSVYRYGGEEFLVVVPETVDEGVELAGERIRGAVEALNIPHPVSTTSDVVTVSVGCASVTRHNSVQYSTWKEAVDAADQALYRAKNAGRNRVEGPIDGH